MILGLNSIDYIGGQEGMLQEMVAPSARQAAVQTGPTRLSKGNTVGIVQGYPSLLLIPASFAIAALSHAYIEKPFLRLKARFEPSEQRAHVQEEMLGEAALESA